MLDLTILLMPSDWNEGRLGRSIESIVRLMLESGLQVQCQITEFLPTGTDLTLLRSQRITALPAVIQQCLERENFDYFVDYGTTARGMRRAVRCAKGRYVALLREGDEIGFRWTADKRLLEDLDILISVPVASGASLSTHQRLAADPLDCRALPTLVGVATAYEGALIVARDFLESVLGRVGYDAEPGYYGFLNEVLSLALVHDSGRVKHTEQIGVFPDPHHFEMHRERTSEYTLPCIVTRRRSAPRPHEEGTEAIIDTVFVRLAAMFSRHSAPLPVSAWSESLDDCIAGRPTLHLDNVLRWLSDCVICSWGWSPGSNQVRHISLVTPETRQRPQNPSISLVSSAFRGHAVIHSFFVNLLQQTAIDSCELIVVTPEPNFLLDLVCEYYALNFPLIRLIHLDHDPGIYGCWNVAIEASRGRFLSNANLDDRRDRTHVERMFDLLEQTGADVASAAVAITDDMEELRRFDGRMASLNWDSGRTIWFGGDGPTVNEMGLRDFFIFDDDGAVKQCMNFPHCMPMWRRSLHDRLGIFEERRDGTYADFAFWLRCVSRGLRFVHVVDPLGLYFVDARSHNRRNASSVTWERIVRESLPTEIVLRLPSHVQLATAKVSPSLPQSPRSSHPRLNFGSQITQNYGRHRSGWAYAMQGLAGFHDATAPVYCNTFIEKRFVWGSDPGDGGAGPAEPHLDPWIGFVHVPPNVPTWFQFEQSNEQIFSTRAWQRSLPLCRGLFVLSDYHRRYLLDLLKPAFPISVLYHPTEFPPVGFQIDRYRVNPMKRVVQVGWWLRRLTAIDRIRTNKQIPTLLGANDWSKNLLTYAERRYNAICEPGSAEAIDFLDNDDYDNLLAENIVFVDFYDTSANNAVIECIARATPVVVCRHPAVEEYLGADYPLFYHDLVNASKLASDIGRVRAAHQFLKDDGLRRRFTIETFARSFAESEVVDGATR